MLIFRYALGFFIQLLPYAFFCCCPFADRFKISRKQTAGIACAILVVMGALFVWLGLYPPLEPLAKHHAATCNLIFYLTLLLLLVFYFVVIRADLFQKLFVFFIAMNYGFLMMKTIGLLLTALVAPEAGICIPQPGCCFIFRLTPCCFTLFIGSGRGRKGRATAKANEYHRTTGAGLAGMKEDCYGVDIIQN